MAMQGSPQGGFGQLPPGQIIQTPDLNLVMAIQRQLNAQRSAMLAQHKQTLYLGQTIPVGPGGNFSFGPAIKDDPDYKAAKDLIRETLDFYKGDK